MKTRKRSSKGETPDFIPVSVGCDAPEPTAFEAKVKAAKKGGYRMVSIEPITGPTWEQRTSGEDSWESFTVMAGSLHKVVETDLIHGYLKPETYRANQEMLKWKSDILQKYGMSASIRVLEPVWMPTPWYQDKPELKGCRCDQPAVSRSAHYALNIDHPRVLEHYYQLGRRLVEIAPAIGRLTVWTNDSGGGINWCEGLYPGPNGPEATKERDMGERVQQWFQAIRDGSRAGGRELQIDFSPGHFTPRELTALTAALKPPTRLMESGREQCKGTKIEFLSQVDVTGGYLWQPFIAPPFLFQAAERLMNMKAEGKEGAEGAKYLASGYLQEGPIPGSKAPLQVLAERCFKKCPTNLREVDESVYAVALKLVGKRHAPGLYSAWKDVDYALRKTHGFSFFYAIMGRRWLTRPFVPAPSALSAEERGYWSQYSMKDRDLELSFKTLLVDENKPALSIDQYASRYDPLEQQQQEFQRAIGALEKELKTAKKRTAAWTYLQDQRDRIDMLASLLRCELHAVGVQWVIDRFADHPERDKWAQPREKRRLYEMIDWEIENCRHIIELLKQPIAPLIVTGKESTYALPENISELLDKKIAIMQRHRHRVEEIFPGVSIKGYQALSYAEDGRLITAEEAQAQLKKPGDVSKQEMSTT